MSKAQPSVGTEGTPCSSCGRKAPLCVCDALNPQATRHRVVVLQHPQEQDTALGSVPLLTAGLTHCDVVVGLSWRNLAEVLGTDQAPLRPWAVLYPASLPKGALKALETSDTGRKHGAYLVNTRGRILPDWPALGGIIILDGTWSQAKALWWRNPWLLKLPRLGFSSPPQSIYGRVRKEPKPGYMSSLEATAAALDALSEPEIIGQNLRRVFRTLVQRLRDSAPKKMASRRPNRGRPKNQGAALAGANAPSIKVETHDV
jgi:DTW domain-containing protein YfiP